MVGNAELLRAKARKPAQRQNRKKVGAPQSADQVGGENADQVECARVAEGEEVVAQGAGGDAAADEGVIADEGGGGRGGEQDAADLFPEQDAIRAMADAAWDRLKDSTRQTFDDWVAVGKSVVADTTEAMNKSGQNTTTGEKFYKFYYPLEQKRRYSGMDKTTRSYLRTLIANLEAIQTWRVTKLDDQKRFKLNHPAWVVREWRACNPTPGQAVTTPRRKTDYKSQVEKLKKELGHKDARIKEVEEERDSLEESELAERVHSLEIENEHLNVLDTILHPEAHPEAKEKSPEEWAEHIWQVFGEKIAEEIGRALLRHPVVNVPVV